MPRRDQAGRWLAQRPRRCSRIIAFAIDALRERLGATIGLLSGALLLLIASQNVGQTRCTRGASLDNCGSRGLTCTSASGTQGPVTLVVAIGPRQSAAAEPTIQQYVTFLPSAGLVPA